MTANLTSPNSVVSAATLALSPSTIAPEDVMHGEPRAAVRELMSTRGVGVGVWELTRGTVVDVEVDEVFVVVSGRGVVEIEGEDEALELGPGSVCRLGAGTRTTWTVTETLRKVYVTLPGASAEAAE